MNHKATPETLNMLTVHIKSTSVELKIKIIKLNIFAPKKNKVG